MSHKTALKRGLFVSAAIRSSGDDGGRQFGYRISNRIKLDHFKEKIS